ncbi:MAG: hypothetical protein KKF67_00210 [Nanoarchaeota archaeon]|nr:hypothetical protein [Nanoarchaeota archaeon]
MLNKNEITAIIASTIILGFVISLMKSLNAFLYTSLSILIIILINIAAKKIASFNLDSEIETKIWELKRYGYHTHNYFKKSLPIGLILPFLTAVLSFGYINWMASLVFDVKPKIYRAAKRHGLYKFTEMTEYHIGLIAAAGISANILFAVIGYLIGFSDFARLNIYYALFNMIPFSDLDGDKIFFGSLVLWSFLAAIVLIGLLFTIFII